MLNRSLYSLFIIAALVGCAGCRKKPTQQRTEEKSAITTTEKRVSGPYADPRAKEDLENY